MSGPILVARIVGTPFGLHDLRPDSELMRVATLAGRDGRTASVVDCANFETLEMLYPAEVQNEAYAWALRQPAGLAVKLTSQHNSRSLSLPSSLRKRQAGAYERLGERLVARIDPHAVCFKVDSRKDLVPTLLAAARVRAMRPRARIFSFGAAFRDDSVLHRAVREFDAVLLCGGLQLADVCDEPDRRLWRGIPNLAYHDGARFTLTRREMSPRPDCDVSFSLEKFLYTAPTAYSKIRVFDIFAVQSGVGSSGMEPGTAPDRSRNHGMLSAIRALNQTFDTYAFCIGAADASDPLDHGLERALLTAGLRILYSTTLNPGSTARTRLGLLAASGCAAVDIPVGSGSQRLLDTYYRRDFTVTQVERLTRAARYAGLYTSMQFTFPCSEDDYHTEDETVRLIRRANPNSAVVTPDESAGIDRAGTLAQEFAPLRFRARARERKQRAALGQKIHDLNVSLNIDARSAMIAGLAGYRGRESAFVEMIGLQLLSGDTTGIAETIEHINAGARKPSRVAAFEPLKIAQNVAAN